MNITLAQAETIINGALAHARSLEAKPLAVIVLDSGGHPVAFKREDKASLFRYNIAKAKATGALGMGVDTKVIAAKSKENPTFFASISAIPEVDIAYSPGGNLIKNSVGHIIGAIGISGDTGEIDEICGLAGIAQISAVGE